MSKELMNTTEMKEVISKRTACMKVFEHADHRFTAAIYGTPVHYMKDGRWEEIDNRLEAAADKVPADADDMENISGAFRVRLSNKVKKAHMGLRGCQRRETPDFERDRGGAAAG